MKEKTGTSIMPVTGSSFRRESLQILLETEGCRDLRDHGQTQERGKKGEGETPLDHFFRLPRPPRASSTRSTQMSVLTRQGSRPPSHSQTWATSRLRRSR